MQAGPSLDTPDAQCIGAQECELQLDMHAPESATSGIAAGALAFSQPSFVTQARLVRFGDSQAPAASAAILFELSSSDVELSAAKLDDSGSRAIVRLWNRKREKLATRVALGSAALAGRKVARVALCDLDEREQRALPHECGSVQIELLPFGLATIAFTLDS